MRFILVGTLVAMSLAASLWHQQSAARTEMDVPYVEGGGEQQKLDLYLPAKPGFATVVHVFGGGWHVGDRKQVARVGEMLQRLGYGCALPSHRLGPDAKWPAQIEDLAAAFAWVKKNVKTRGGDPDRIFVMGHSSGGQLAALLSTDPRWLAKHGLKPSDIRGCIGLSPALDLTQHPDGRGFGDALMGGRGADTFNRDPAVLKDASPLEHLAGGAPPILIAVAQTDFPMLEADANVFEKKAEAAGVPATVRTFKGRTHGTMTDGLVTENDPLQKYVRRFLAVNAPEPRAGLPGVEFTQSPNWDVRSIGGKIDTVVVHATVIPTLKETVDRFLDDKQYHVSAHYVVDRDGKTVQMVDEKMAAWHAGVSELEGKTGVNDFSVGVELVNLNDGKEPFTEAQYEALAKIIRHLRETWSIPDSRIVSHASVARPPGRKSDPLGFDFAKLYALLK